MGEKYTGCKPWMIKFLETIRNKLLGCVKVAIGPCEGLMNVDFSLISMFLWMNVHTRKS